MNRFLLLLCLVCGMAVQTFAVEKPRIIVTSDGEIDDQCSMIRFMLYTNECDVEGIIFSSLLFFDVDDHAAVTRQSRCSVVFHFQYEVHRPFARWHHTTRGYLERGFRLVKVLDRHR